MSAWLATLEALTESFREQRAERLEREAKRREFEALVAGKSVGEARDEGRWYLERALAERERFHRLDGCQEADIVAECRACGCCTTRAGRCRCSLLCVSCRSAIGLEKRVKFLRALSAHLDAHGHLCAASRGWRRWSQKFLTLTAPHAAGDTVQGRIARVAAAFPVFIRSLNSWLRARDAGRSTAWYRVYEWTPGTDGLGHPHVHVWIFCPYLDRDLVLEWWRAALNSTDTIVLRAHDDLIVDLRACSTSENVAAELIKYLTKDIDNCGRKIAPEVYAQVYAAFAGGRATQGSSGFMALAVRAARACPECGDTSPRKVYLPGRVPSRQRLSAIEKLAAELTAVATAPLSSEERTAAYEQVYGKARVPQ